MTMNNKKMEELLVEMNFVSNEQLLKILKLQKKNKKVIGQLLVEEGFITEKEIIEVLQVQYGMS